MKVYDLQLYLIKVEIFIDYKGIYNALIGDYVEKVYESVETRFDNMSNWEFINLLFEEEPDYGLECKYCERNDCENCNTDDYDFVIGCEIINIKYSIEDIKPIDPSDIEKKYKFVSHLVWGESDFEIWVNEDHEVFNNKDYDSVDYDGEVDYKVLITLTEWFLIEATNEKSALEIIKKKIEIEALLDKLYYDDEEDEIDEN